MNWPLFFRLATPIFFCIIAIGLFIWGWLGKRVGNQPVCRKCGYDLTGRPPDSHRCSECGSNLALSGDIRTGVQRRRAVILVFAALVICICGVSLHSVDSETWRSAPEELTPTWWLLHTAKAGRFFVGCMTSYSGVDQKLIDRYGRRRLSVAETAALAKIIMAASDAAIDEPLCGVVGEARLNNLVSDDEWENFWLRHTYSEFTVRNVVQRGHSIPYRIETFDGVELDGPHEARWQVALVSMKINGINCPSGGDSDDLLELPKTILDRENNGPQLLTATIEAHSTELPTRRIHRTLSASFQLQNEPSVRLVKPDAEIRAAMRRAVSASVQRNADDPTKVHMTWQCSAAPLPGNFDVYLIANEKEIPCGWLVFDKGRASQGNGQGDPKVAAGPIDLVLRPNPEAASKQLSSEHIYGEEIVFKDVAIK